LKLYLCIFKFKGMRTILLVTMFAVFGLNGFSQKDPMKYGKPGESEINLTEYQNADAVILCDFGEYYLNGRVGPVYLYFKRHLRIKILTDKGLKYAQQSIRYYDMTKASFYQNSSGFELRAQTLNFEPNGKMVKSKLKQKDIVRSTVYNDFNTEVTLNFPDVKVGSIIEYEINIPTLDLVNPPIWYFQYEIPVLWSELRITSPTDIDYGAKVYNCNSLDVFNKNSISTSVSLPRGSALYMANQLQFVKTNVPAYYPSQSINSENPGRMYIKCMLEYASRKFAPPGMEELFKAVDPNYKYLDKAEKSSTLRNSSYILYTKPNLESVAKDLMKDPGFGPPMIINMGLRDTLQKITEGCKTAEDKTNAIYKFVYNHYNWNGSYRTFVNMSLPIKVVEFASRFADSDANMNTSLSKAYRKQSGTSSEINFTLINLLNTAGIKAFPVLVSTKDFDMIDTSFYNLQQFNDVLACVEIEGDYYLLDAVKKDNGTLLSTTPMNKYGLLIKKNEAEWISINQEN
jgi:hypothetical protein